MPIHHSFKERKMSEERLMDAYNKVADIVCLLVDDDPTLLSTEPKRQDLRMKVEKILQAEIGLKVKRFNVLVDELTGAINFDIELCR